MRPAAIVVDGYGLNEATVWRPRGRLLPAFLYLALIQAVVVFVQLVNSLFAGVDEESLPS